MSNEEGQEPSKMKQKMEEQITTPNLQLVGSARLDGLPDQAFFKSFTARRRRELVYVVHAEADDFKLNLEVRGSGVMTARVRMPCMSVEDGVVDQNDADHILSWAHNGEQAVIRTKLDHRHLETYPCPQQVMQAFLDAIGTQTKAVCTGGYLQWKSIMQLFANRIARERGVPVQIVALLPLPAEQTGARGRGLTEIETHDLTDPEAPVAIKGYEDEFTDLDDNTTPEGMCLMLLPPGYLVCRRHREIFTAG